MDVKTIQIIIKIVIIICTIAAFILSAGILGCMKRWIDALKMRRKDDEKHEVTITILPSRLHDGIKKQMDKPSHAYFNYNRIDRFLKQNGAGFIHGYYLNPVNFIFFKCLYAIVFILFAILLETHPIVATIAGIIGFFVLDFEVYLKNKRENARMLDDIQRANETIKMYGEVSGTLYSAIFECYKYTENVRLKQGFYELYGELQMTHSYELSINHFLEKFNNTYLESLGRSIEQAGTAGFNPHLLEDMSRDMAELQREQNYNYKNTLKQRWSVLLIFMLTSMIFIFMYGILGGYLTGNIWVE